MGVTVRKLKHSFFLWDILFIGVLIVLSLFLISFYFNASTIQTYYNDWIVHAFRVKSLMEYGLSSWSHSWSNGISIWKSYQFVPHYMTAIVSTVFDVSITRAMVLMTISLFVFLRLFLYGVLRLLKFSPITAFICAVMSYDIAQFWGGVADYSLLFGFTFTPIMIFLWVKYFEGKIQYLFPYIVGVTFYIHPILGYSAFGLWIMSIIFSERRIISREHIIQFFIFMAASSLFWFPLVVKTSYSYTSPVFANRYFLNLVLSSYKYFGLSLVILASLLISGARIFMPLEGKFRWIRILFIYVVGYFVLVVLGLNFDLPKAIAQLQYTRGVTLIGIAAIMVFASVVERLRMISSTVLKGILLFLLSLVVIEGMYFSSEYSSSPGKDFPEAITAFERKFPEKDLKNVHVWSSTIGNSSYYPSLDKKYPYSYMGHLDSNQIAPRISPLIIYTPYIDKVPLANMARLDDYFKISGVQYVLFDESSPFTNTLVSSDRQIYKDLGIIRDKDARYHAFEVPWEVRSAAAIDKKYINELKTFPVKLDLMAINDQIALDEYVHTFVTMLYQPENIPLAVTYPSNNTLNISIPKNVKTNTVYVNESYDPGWRGYFNKQKVTIAPSGPNYMKITLPGKVESGIITMVHHWPLSHYISWFLLLIIPIEIFIANCLRRKTHKHYETN